MDNNLDKYDYIELMTYDIHGIPRGRVVASRRMKSVIQYGMGMAAGMCYEGVHNEYPHNEYFSLQICNHLMRPLMNTLVDAQKSVQGKHKMGQVICELWRDDRTKEPTTPRTIAVAQLDRLRAMGYTLRSSSEIEFTLPHTGSAVALNEESGYSNLRRQYYWQELLVDFMEEMQEMNVYIDTVHTECGFGRYEYTLDVVEGIESADMMSRLRTAASVFFRKRGFQIDFRPQTLDSEFTQTLNLNMSLWSHDFENLFYDSQSSDCLSQLGRYWIGGLIAHASALTALGCPTVSCYRYVGGHLAPTYANWGFDDRGVAFRVKVEGTNVYLENRVCTSQANPYLVMAGVVAAGIDGIERRITLNDVIQKLPCDLESALMALESDEYMVASLGEDFVQLYAHNKRKYEIESLKALCSDVSDDKEKLVLERSFYQAFA